PGRQRALLGGDFYDAVQTGPQRLSLLVGDVCGHGAEEAALGVTLRVAWRALTLAGVPETDLLRTVERVLVSQRRAEGPFAAPAAAHWPRCLTGWSARRNSATTAHSPTTSPCCC